jgi:hypothetical protein
MNKTEKEFLIIFADAHLTYSPSTLNLFYKLKERYNVELIAARQATYYTTNEVRDADIRFIDFEVKRTVVDFARILFYRIADKLYKPSEETLIKRTLPNYMTKALVKFIKETKKEIIAVDALVLWCVQQAGKRAHWLSLEIHDNDIYFKDTRLETYKSVIIQSQERLEHLFPLQKPKYFIVQNAPKNIDFIPAYAERKKTDLVYCGSSVYGFGIVSCLDFIKDYKEYTLTVKGAFPRDVGKLINEFYADLLIEKRLIIDDEYLTEHDLTHYLSKFRIGFAFYDMYRFPHLRTFNYYTAPSGKVFQYLNSGIPIVGNILPGFKFIEEKNCGKLISHISSIQLKLAIDAIENDYLTCAQNAKRLSYQYDFNKMIQPFLEFINNDEYSC